MPRERGESSSSSVVVKKPTTAAPKPIKISAKKQEEIKKDTALQNIESGYNTYKNTRDTEGSIYTKARDQGFDAMDAAGNQLENETNRIETQYQGGQQDLNQRSQSQEKNVMEAYEGSKNQVTDASKPYSGGILSGMKKNMEGAQTLEQMRARQNNLQNEGTFKSYASEADAQGQMLEGDYRKYGGDFEQAAERQKRQGLSDYGTLSALGAQAAGASMAGPMTGAQAQGVAAANQRQASQAYTMAQKRMQNLQDQKRQSDLAFGERLSSQKAGLRSRGLEAAGDNIRSDYQMGQQAVQDYQGGLANYANQGQAFRGEQSGYGANIRNSMGAQADTRFQNQTSQAGRRIGGAQENYGMNVGAAGENQAFKQGQEQMKYGEAGRQRDLSIANQQFSSQMNQQNTLANRSMWMGLAGAALGAGGQMGGGYLGRK